MFHVFKQLNIRNRAYVIDNKGNKLFYGTVFQCNKFIAYMEGDKEHDGKDQSDSVTKRKVCS